jgi:hypothetical protein
MVELGFAVVGFAWVEWLREQGTLTDEKHMPG